MSLLTQKARYSERQFTTFRILLGVYLIIHFLALVPYAAELFSDSGILSDLTLNPFSASWPNPLFCWRSPAAASSLIIIAVLAAVKLSCGWHRKLSAVILIFIWSCLFTANPFIANPSLGYIGLLLALTLCIPAGEKITPSAKSSWYMPAMVPWVAWAMMAIGYSFSGWLKLSSPSWLSGDALAQVLENPLARPNGLRTLLLSLPAEILKLATWLTLAAEILFLPLCLSKKSRPWIWLTMTLMHIGIVFVIDFADLSCGMLLLHLFTFQTSWLPARKPVGDARHILFIDGECLFCQGSGKFLTKLDRQAVLHFAPLQGETASQLLNDEQRQLVDANNHASGAAILIENAQLNGDDTSARTWSGHLAVLRSLYLVGSLPSLVWLLHYLPASWLSAVYRAIARQRYRFGRNQACSLDRSASDRYLP